MPSSFFFFVCVSLWLPGTNPVYFQHLRAIPAMSSQESFNTQSLHFHAYQIQVRRLISLLQFSSHPFALKWVTQELFNIGSVSPVNILKGTKRPLCSAPSPGSTGTSIGGMLNGFLLNEFLFPVGWFVGSEYSCSSKRTLNIHKNRSPKGAISFLSFEKRTSCYFDIPLLTLLNFFGNSILNREGKE